jgi:hypothetical protein
MDETAVLVQVLAEIDWKPIHGLRLVPAIDNTQKAHHRCLYVAGQLYNVPRDAFLCVDSHLVMLIGSKDDFTLTEFCDRVKNGEPVTAEVKRPVVADRQKSLFED